jgi:peptidoglycan/LPS O-acetylase OafA/YrhL
VAFIGTTASLPGWFKFAVFALLTFNTAVFLASGTPSDALDSIAWLTLLVLFEFEAGYIDRLRRERAAPAIRAVRLAAAAALVVAMTGYVHEKEWLDALNVGLWFAVVALLELEVRRPDTVMRYRAAFVSAATAFFAGLAILVAVWLWRGDWFEAYDASLWLVAFAVLEMDVLGFIVKGRPAA